MIAIALRDMTVQVLSINTCSNKTDEMHELWAVKQHDKKSFKIHESKDKEKIEMLKDVINKAIEEGEYLVDLTKGLE